MVVLGTSGVIPLSPVGAGAADTPSSCRDPGPITTPAMTGTVEYREEGTDRLRLTYNVSQAPTDFTVRLSGVREIVSVSGFTRANETAFRWDGTTSAPTITYEAISASADDWGNGVFVRPDHSTPVNLTTEIGFVSEQLMSLGGSYTVETVSNGCETIQLVVPCGVVIEETRADVKESLRAASEDLNIGNRWSETTVLAVEDVRNFGVVGAYFGEGDMIVESGAETNTAGNTWIHEYVHARQAYAPASNASWLSEATAEYYAARLTFKQGLISRDEYAEAVGETLAEPAVLSENTTWATLTPYEQGAVVATGLDRRLRTASDGAATFQTVQRALNEEAMDGDGPVTHTQTRSLIRQQANQSVADWYDRVTTTRTVPEVRPLGAGSGLQDYRTSFLDRFLADLSGSIDEFMERIDHFLNPPGTCSRTRMVI